MSKTVKIKVPTFTEKEVRALAARVKRAAKNPRKRHNKKLFHQVADDLLNHTHLAEYDQGVYCRGRYDAKKQELCGTAACIAGQVCLSVGFSVIELYAIEYPYEVFGYDLGDLFTDLVCDGAQEIAAAQLGLSDNELSLFEGIPTSSSWSREYSRRFNAAKTVRGRAEVAAEYLKAIADGTASIPDSSLR